MDLSNKTDAELDEMRRAIGSEIRRRARMGASPERLDQTVREYQKEVGIKDGDDWVDPATALTRPMKGAKRTHKGKLWRSTIDHNVFEPGVSGWKLEPETDPETGETIYPPFNRPSGAHDAYRKGWRITGEDGNVYAANRDGVDWPPEIAPQDWDLVESEPDPEPGPPEEPEPEPEEPVDPEGPEPGDGEGDEDEEPEPEPDPESGPPGAGEPEPEGPTDPEGPVDPEEPGDGDEDEESEPPEEEEPEPEPEPGTLDNPFIWAAGDEYEIDHYIIYNGTVYRVLQAHTSAAHWPPDAVASLYERQ